MTVDFPPSYPAQTTPVSKPVDVQTLQATFAALLRSYGTEKGDTQTDTLLEILRPAPSDNADKNDRWQLHRENQQQGERNDFTQIDRKQQDKSEVRSSDMNADYRNRSDRQDTLQHEYQQKSERSERQSAIQTGTITPIMSASPPSGHAKPDESLPGWTHSPLQKKAGAEMVVVNNSSLSVNVAAPNSAASNVQAGMLMPMNVNVPTAAAAPATPQVTPPQTFTVFTPLGRIGQSSEKTDEKENEDEKTVDENSSKKKQQPFAVFETIRSETIRPLQRNRPQQPKESVAPAREKPKEAEPEQSQSIQTLKELLNTSVQDTAASKKGEPNQPNPMQYIHRIAAACEAAAQYAPIRMKINLDHLGTLALRFFYKADKLALRFETPSKESAQFLRKNLDGLKTILSQRNVKIVDIEIARLVP